MAIDFAPPLGYNTHKRAVSRWHPVGGQSSDKFIARRNAAFLMLMGGGYFFASLPMMWPSLKPAVNTALANVSNAMISPTLTGLTSFVSRLEDWPRLSCGPAGFPCRHGQLSTYGNVCQAFFAKIFGERAESVGAVSKKVFGSRCRGGARWRLLYYLTVRIRVLMMCMLLAHMIEDRGRS